MTATDIRKELNQHANPEKAEFLKRFFKTGPGQYAEGDRLIGVTVPAQRVVAKKFLEISLKELIKLLQSPIHEERLTSLIILVNKFRKSSPADRLEIYRLYLANTKYINNWDLVDSSAEYIVGEYLGDKARPVLRKLARSKSIWERRIAMLATFYSIKNKKSELAFEIAELLLNDSEDLIHKAVGWMLRELGKKCGQDVEERFLQKHAKGMPRTMLRYAIERFPEEKRKWYLQLKD
jgi:3-methyladenine DNA glycosylase AlkD